MGFLDRLGQRLSDLVDDLAGPEDLRQAIERAEEALARGAFAEAERELARLIAEHPGSVRGWQLLGLSQLRGGRPAAAAASLEQAHALRPEAFAILATLAEAQRAAGQGEAALRSYKQALSCRADETMLAQVFAGLGELYLVRGEAERAVRELRKAVALAREAELALIGRLGVAQLRAGQLELARASLERAATAEPLDREVALCLAQALLDLGHAEEARLAALRLREHDSSAEARCAHARTLLALGEREAARDELLRALESDPRRPEPHLLLARVHAAARDPEIAIRHLRTAIELQPAAQASALLRELVDLELELEPAPAELAADAERLLALAPADALALAARAVAGLPAERERAGQLLARALAGGESFPARLGQGLCFLALGQPAPATTALRIALRLRPESVRARSLFARAAGELAGGAAAAAAADLYPLIRRCHALFLSASALSELAPEVARIQEVYDRPLLVAVMGEFSTGKSTFVNALVGEPVAPMGVTPTTATINLLKYGTERAARVIWADDREELLRWAELESFLGSLSNTRARQVRLVEILYPSEELLRVNVVDTPGLNSLHEEHEATAREYMAQADAVVWLFSAQQAGKQTEEQALELLRRHRLKTVGVLNKIDRLGAGELALVVGHLERSFEGLVEAVIPVSAREALEGMLAGSAERLAASRFAELRAVLDERLFARSRAIKREALERRLAGVLAHASERVHAARERIEAALRAVEERARELETLLPATAMESERLALEEGLRVVYRRGAEEVLDFVRPRRWALGEHRAAAADRDYLLELLADGLAGLCEESHARMARSLRGAVRAVEAGLPPPAPDSRALPLAELADERLALLRAQVYTRYTAFARGFLLGGRVDHFFTARLPRLDLTLEAVLEALLEGRVDLERELLEPLARWYREAAQALARALDGRRQEIELERLDLDARLLGPLAGMARTVAAASASAPERG